MIKYDEIDRGESGATEKSSKSWRIVKSWKTSKT